MEGLVPSRLVNRETLSGLLLFCIGAAGAVIASTYPIGTAARMGPAYFPLLLCGGLIIVGTLIMVTSANAAVDSLGAINWRPLILFPFALIAFGLLLTHGGLIVASVVLVFLAAAGGRDFRLREVAILSVCFTAAAYVIFILGLGLPMHLLPDWIL